MTADGAVKDDEGAAAEMPKMKTHTGAKRRYKVTGTGKIMARQAGKAHLNEHKPAKVTNRRLEGLRELSKADSKKAKKLLGK